MMIVGPADAQHADLAVRWTGKILAAALNFEVDITVRFDARNGQLTGAIDIPSQGAYQLQLVDLVHEHPRIRFAMDVPGRPTFAGTRTSDSITGEFSQGNVTGTFTLARVTDTPESTELLPYQEEDVTFHNGDVTLAGTLTIPHSPGPYPAIVMISGSGPQNRDEEIFGFKPFRMIADYLSRNGIAVLRYDDRGVGGSTGTVATSTSEDFAQDALAAVALLRARADIVAAQVGLLGHSEGGIVATIAATQSPDVAYIILLAAPGLRGDEILYLQGERILRASGGTEEAIREQRQLQRATFGAVRTGQGWDDVRRSIERQVRSQIARLPAAQRDALDIESVVATQVEIGIRQVQTPWFRFFIDHDPSIALRRVRVPVLALFGELDLQVPADVNYDAMMRAFAQGGHTDHTLTILPKANHLFLAAVTGSPSEYASLTKEFIPGFLETISEWIASRTSAASGPTPR